MEPKHITQRNVVIRFPVTSKKNHLQIPPEIPTNPFLHLAPAPSNSLYTNPFYNVNVAPTIPPRNGHTSPHQWEKFD